jgi:hypothetical protein
MKFVSVQVIQDFKPVETDRLTFGLIELKRVRGLNFVAKLVCGIIIV